MPPNCAASLIFVQAKNDNYFIYPNCLVSQEDPKNNQGQNQSNAGKGAVNPQATAANANNNSQNSQASNLANNQNNLNNPANTANTASNPMPQSNQTSTPAQSTQQQDSTCFLNSNAKNINSPLNPLNTLNAPGHSANPCLFAEALLNKVCEFGPTCWILAGLIDRRKPADAIHFKCIFKSKPITKLTRNPLTHRLVIQVHSFQQNRKLHKINISINLKKLNLKI